MASGNVFDNLPEFGHGMKASETTLVKTFIGLIGAIGGWGIVQAFAYFFLNPEAFFVSSFLLLLSIGLYAEKICLENATLTLNRESLKTKLIETAAKVEILDIYVRNKEKEIEKCESECEIGIVDNEPKTDFNEMVKIHNQDDAGEPNMSAISTITEPISKIMKTLAEEKLVESGDCSG